MINDTLPSLSYRAEIVGSATLSGSYFHTLASPGSVSFIVTSRVGGTVDIWPRLYLTMRAQSLQGGGARSASFSASYRVITAYQVLTPGAIATPCSGLPPTTACLADLDDGSGNGIPDGGITIDDLLYFLVKFDAGSAAADLDDGSGTGTPDGGVTIDDLLFFLAHFDAGC